ncbi:MAG: hypothetical protein K5856_08805 [Bacteroidaceae bacterium]|nr:hypothetical protein [Bacteroidaceae bacterium]
MKKALILVVTLFVLITVIVILGNIITIGEKLTEVFGVTYFEYGFYILLLCIFAYLVYVAILQPMWRIHHAPEFPVLSVAEKESGIADDVYKARLMSFAEKLCNNCYYLPLDQRTAHQAEMRTELAAVKSQTDIEALKSFLSAELKQRYRIVNKQIITYATKVFIITSISSSNRIDTLATVGLNYRLIADIVRASGFRPNKLQLIKIYYYVISSAFLSYFFQDAVDSVGDIVDGFTDSAADVDVTDVEMPDVEIPDVDPSSVDFTQYVKNLNLPGIPLAPLADGLANAVMTIAIGYITEYYLRKGSKELKGAKGRAVKLKARVKALGQIPRLLVEVPQQLGDTGLSWAIKGFEKAYSKVSKKANPEDLAYAVNDFDAFEAEESMKPADKPKKKGLFNFWR